MGDGSGAGIKHVVIIEDDDDISRLIAWHLEREGGYEVSEHRTGEDGFEACRSGADLVILDLNLPGGDGLDVCRRLRRTEATAAMPILVLTARASEHDRIRGLDLGADDYITKPFSVRELIARVRALLRRAGRSAGEEDLYEDAKLKIEFGKMRTFVAGKPVSLTRKEWGLLCHLVRNRGRVLTREAILRSVWGEDFFGVDRTVDVHVRHLRRKLGEGAGPLETVIGVGYRWRD